MLDEVLAGSGSTDGSDDDSQLVANAKKIALFTIGVAYQRYVDALEKQQEVIMHIADIVTETFAMESVLLRSRKLEARGKETIAADICAVFLRDAMAREEISARKVLGACSEGETLRTNMTLLRRLARYEPADDVVLRRKIASRLLARERFIV